MSGKKRSIGRILFCTSLSVLFCASALYAASATRAPQVEKPAEVKRTIKMEKNSSRVVVRPDLVVSDISLTNNCAIKYTIKNISRGGVPDAAYQNPSKGFLKMYDGTKFLGGISLKDADPYGHLKKGGGSETGVSLPGNYNPSGIHFIRVVVDAIDIVKETNEKNNEGKKKLACAPPVQIKQMSIGSDAAGNCFVHMFLNRDGNTSLPLSQSKVSFSNRSSWDQIKWGNPKAVYFTSFKQGSSSSTCAYYPCTIHVSIDATFIKDTQGRLFDGDYDGMPGGNFIQNIVVNDASSWGTFNH